MLEAISILIFCNIIVSVLAGWDSPAMQALKVVIVIFASILLYEVFDSVDSVNRALLPFMQ